MKTFTSVVLILVVALLGSCKKKNDGEPAPTGHSAIMPLTVGNYWEFIDSTFSNNKVVSVDTTRISIINSKNITYQGKSYHVYFWNWDVVGIANMSFFASNESDGLYFFGGTNGKEDFIMTKSLNYKFPVQVGETWDCIDVGYSPSDSTFEILDTLQIECVSINTAFKTHAGEFSCYAYHVIPSSSKSMSPFLTGLYGIASPDNYAVDYTAYLKPGFGYIGSITKSNGVVTGKKTLLSYHLN
jgi:hypothetical protein